MEYVIASNVMLWLAVIVMATACLALSRQVGILHERSAPLGAVISDKGPEVGDQSPKFDLADYKGDVITLGGKRNSGADQLALFLAPNCPMCNKILPTARALANDENLDVVVISDGPKEEHEHFLKTHNLGKIPYVISADVGMHFQVGKVPYAVLIDRNGKIAAKGLVNTREHLESLLEAKAMGLESLQEYFEKHEHHHHDHATPTRNGAEHAATNGAGAPH
jgi:methylamine dehydrogenase accessory protein MauD